MAGVNDPNPLRIDLGRIVISRAVAEAYDALTIERTVLGHRLFGMLSRHELGDWGDLTVQERTANREAILARGYVVSRYRLPDTGRVVCFQTTPARHETRIFFRDETRLVFGDGG